MLSHWLLDWLMHRPDMPIGLEGDKYGLGLWSQVPLTIALEFGLLAVGVWIYAASTKPIGRAGVWGLVGLAAFLSLIYVMSFSGPPPPDPKTLAYVGLSAWLFPLWAWWIDRNRTALSD